MVTHAQLAAKLLRESANFFRAVGEQNPDLETNLRPMASACDTVAGLVETDPNGELSPDTKLETDAE